MPRIHDRIFARVRPTLSKDSWEIFLEEGDLGKPGDTQKEII
jgi:hypothetical protein